MIRLLMIDDDLEVLNVNKKFFEDKGIKVEICDKASKGEEIAKKFKPGCILLDIMMPEIDGFELCRNIRKFSDVPILFLSGKVSEEDKLLGFEAGCDDYVEKPYSLNELYARINAHVKRAKTRTVVTERNTVDIDPFYLDKEKHKLFYNDEEILISNKEYDLMLYLAMNTGKEITFEEIGIRLWGTYSENDRRNVMVNVSRLRKKIEDATGIDNLIETVWSKGYKMVRLKK